MPISGDAGRKGDLVIEFDIQFPQQLTTERKQLILKALLWGIQRTQNIANISELNSCIYTCIINT